MTDKCFENIADFKHVEMTAVSENYVPDPVNRTVEVGNAYYCLIQDHPVPCVLSGNLSISPVTCAGLKLSPIIQYI
jgi:hypothetical protein